MTWELFTKPSRAKHGTARRYQAGCRCEACTETNATRSRKRRLQRYEYAAAHGLPDSVSHGRAAYRNWGCRCAICRAGNAEASAERRSLIGLAEEREH